MTADPQLATRPPRQPRRAQADLSVEGTSPESNPKKPSFVAAKFPLWLERIELPRWVVYAQAALLGFVGLGFFLFGVMVGHFTAPANNLASATFDCRVQGSVAYREDGDLRADEGSVVFLLPVNRKPDQRSDASLVNPGSFQALDNPGIDRIHELGGAVVTTNANGQFDVLVDANDGNGIDYYLLIVSKHKRGTETSQMTKEESASIATFFVPVEDVVEDRSYYWTKLNAFEKQLHLPEIEF